MNQHSPLVELKRQSGDTSIAMLLFPGAGDSITTFVSLVNALELAMPIYGLQPQGLDHRQQPYESLTEMVDAYIETILSRLPGVSYYLCGHSFGGYVALEVAHRLQAENIDVKRLVLLDVTPPEKSCVTRTRIECLLDLIEVMELSSAKSFNIGEELLKSLSDEDQVLLLHERMIKTEILPKRASVESIQGMVRVFIANCHMPYRPVKPYFGNTLLVNAMETKESELEKRENYSLWKAHLPELRYHESPGNHMTLLDGANVETLVHIINSN